MTSLADAPVPLTPDEDALWRAFGRLMVGLPRVLEADLLRATGLSMTDYLILSRLSEEPGQAFRMSDLAMRVGLSASRITRAVDELVARGHVVKTPSERDARGNVATLTDAGMARLEQAWPAHLASVRARFMDQLSAQDAAVMSRVLGAVVSGLEGAAGRGACGEGAAGALPDAAGCPPD